MCLLASCSVEYSVVELHCCALNTGSAKGEQLFKALLGTTGYAERERKQVCLSRCRASDRALTVSGPQGIYILYIGGDSG